MAKVTKGRFKGLPQQDVLVAKAMTNAQYGGRLSALQAMVQQAGENYLSDVGAAKGTAKATIKAANRARKPTRKLYKTATSSATQAGQDVLTAFGALGAAADPYKAVGAREQGAALQRIATARALALQDLKDRKMDARAGKQLALNQARSGFRSEQAKLQAEGANIRKERGSFLVGQLASRLNARDERREERRENARDRAAEARENALDRQNKTDVAKINDSGGGGGGGGGGGKGKGWGSTPTQKSAAQEKVADYLTWAKKVQGMGMGYDAALQALTAGQKGQQVYKTVGSGPDKKRIKVLKNGVPVMTPELPKLGGGLLLQAALQQIYGGDINADTQRLLRKRGLKPGQLGLSNARTPNPTSGRL